jgi:hypothetical protein
MRVLRLAPPVAVLLVSACADPPPAGWAKGGAPLVIKQMSWKTGAGEEVVVTEDGKVTSDGDHIFTIDRAGRVYDDDKEPVALLLPDGTVEGSEQTSRSDRRHERGAPGGGTAGSPSYRTGRSSTSIRTESGLRTAPGGDATARSIGPARWCRTCTRCIGSLRRRKAAPTSASVLASACGADRRATSVSVQAAMLDARYVADHLEEVRRALGRRSGDAASGLDALVELSTRRRSLIADVEQRQAKRNAAAQEMAKLAKSDPSALEARRAELRAAGDEIAALETELRGLEERMQSALLAVPNLPDASVPSGTGADENPVVRTVGTKPEYTFSPKAHWEVGEQLGILDFERAAKLSGARFSVLFGLGSRLSRALGAFMIDLHTREHGYVEVATPLLVRAPRFSERTASQVRGRPLQDAALGPERSCRSVFDSDGGGAADESPRRGDPRRTATRGLRRSRRASTKRGRIVRKGRPRPHPPTSIRQGGTREIRGAERAPGG